MAAICVAQNSLRISRQQIPQVCGVACVSKRHQSGTVARSQGGNLAAYKRGRGGRSSFSGVVATVFGASGFLGRYVVNRLGKIGSQVICPYRGDPYFMKDLRLCGDLGQVLFLPFHLQDDESLRKVMQYSDVVINLIGRDWETKNFKFHDVNVDGPRRIARIAKECGVQKLIHFSHLNAQPNPPSIYVKDGSEFLRTKYEGELAVKEEFPEAVVFRPADIFGMEDRFIRYYANSWRRAHGTMPLWRKGNNTIKMPVFFGNVAEGVINAIQDPDADGKTYEIVGPGSYYLGDLVDYFYRCMRWPGFKRRDMLLTPFFRFKVMFMARAPSYPILTMDKLDREHVSDEVHDLPTLEDLGVTLTKLEDRAPFELKPFRRHMYYEEKVGEFAEPEPPPIIVA